MAKQEMVYRPNFEKRDGLVVVVTQHFLTKEVLMVAYADEAAWKETLETGEAVYFSTARNRRWKKGEEESGAVLIVRDVRVDCDGDALIYFVEPPVGLPVCHTKAPCCFFRSATLELSEAPKVGPRETLEKVGVILHGNFRCGTFKVGDSFRFTAQIPDDSVGCSGSRCSECGAKSAYCEQFCSTCNLPFIGPFDFPQWSDWMKLGSVERWKLVERIFNEPSRGRLGSVNVLSIPLVPQEVSAVEKLAGHEYHLFKNFRRLDPATIRMTLRA